MIKEAVFERDVLKGRVSPEGGVLHGMVLWTPQPCQFPSNPYHHRVCNRGRGSIPSGSELGDLSKMCNECIDSHLGFILLIVADVGDFAEG
jgi:hypothetical protein